MNIVNKIIAFFFAITLPAFSTDQSEEFLKKISGNNVSFKVENGNISFFGNENSLNDIKSLFEKKRTIRKIF